MRLVKIDFKEASKLLTSGAESERHYLGPLKLNPIYCLTTEDHDALAVFARPTAYTFHHEKPELKDSVELTRLWQSDARRAKGRKLSEFLLAACNWLWCESVPCVFSYTDPSRIGPDGKPHSGVVYQWSGFHKLGESRVTDTWRASRDIPKPPVGRAVRAGEILSTPVCYRQFRTKSRAHLSGSEPYRANFGSKAKGPDWRHIEEGPSLVRVIRDLSGAWRPALSEDEEQGKVLYCKSLTLTIPEIRERLGGRYA